jgi:hypothetical protein
MIELDKLDWGWMDIPSDKTVTDIVTGEIIEEGQYHKNMMIAEIFKRKQYEEVFTVKEGDTVVDIGASIGPFTYSILSKIEYVKGPTLAPISTTTSPSFT